MLSTKRDVVSFQLLMNAPSAHLNSHGLPGEVPPTGSVYFAGKSGFGAGASGLAALPLAILTMVGSTARAPVSAGGFPNGGAVGACVAGVTGSPAFLHASEGLKRKARRCEPRRNRELRAVLKQS